MEPPLPGRGGPPWSLPVHPSPYLIAALTAAAIGSGTASLALTLAAGRRGWRVRPVPLLAAGLLAAAALTLVPPFGSSDQLSYAAYGELAITGHDPYAMTPAALARRGDPVARAVTDGRDRRSVYGPLATGGQALAALGGGASARLTVFVLGLLNVAAFTGTGLLLHRLTRSDGRRQQRAALLWGANPLLLLVLVAGAHVDSQGIVFAVAALAAFGLARRQPTAARQAAAAAGAGALAGAGAAVKVTMALAGLGLALAVLLEARAGRRDAGPAGRTGPRPGPLLAGLATGFGVITAAALTAWGPGSLMPALQAGSQVSIGSPWRAVRSALRLVAGEAAAEDAVRAAAIVLAVVLLLIMLRAIAAGPAGGRIGCTAGRAVIEPPVALAAGPIGPAAGRAGIDPAAALAGAALAAAAVAWLFAWPYVLPWYDSVAWALLAAAPCSRLDGLLLARTTALALGYLPGRGCYRGAPACQAGVPVPPGLGWLETVVRSGITPAVLLAVMAALLVTTGPGRRWRRPAEPAATGTVRPRAEAAGRPPG
jgi:hypothetical protein